MSIRHVWPTLSAGTVLSDVRDSGRSSNDPWRAGARRRERRRRGRRAAALAALLALLACPVGAVEYAYGVEMPPREYRHKPRVPYTLKLVSQKEVNRACGHHRAPGKFLAGCTVLATNTIYVVKSLKSQQLQAVIVHEKAHVNGWMHR